MTNTPTIAASLSEAQKCVVGRLTETPRRAIDFSASIAIRLMWSTSKRPPLVERVEGGSSGHQYYLNETGLEVRHLLNEGESEGSDGITL